MNVRKAFGQAVFRLRTRQSLTQLQLAEKADLHLNSINRIEAGEKSLQIETIEKLAKGLGCSMASLMEETERQKVEKPPSTLPD